MKANPPLSEDEFEKEYNSPYKIKKYHYNFRTDNELTEENLKRTFINLCTSAFFHNKEKTIREEHLNLDSMNSQEKEDVIFRMKKQLEEFNELPINKESFFSAVGKASPFRPSSTYGKRICLCHWLTSCRNRPKGKCRKLKRERIRRKKRSLFGSRLRGICMILIRRRRDRRSTRRYLGNTWQRRRCRKGRKQAQWSR